MLLRASRVLRACRGTGVSAGGCSGGGGSSSSSRAAAAVGVVVAAGAAAAGSAAAVRADSDEEYAACFAPGTNGFPNLTAGEWEPNWDGRAPPKDAPDALKKALRKAPTRHLILIRHGQYDLNYEGEDGDPPLTELGELQAKLTGEHIAAWASSTFQSNPKDTPRPIKISNVYCSDVKRARQTAEIISAALHRSDAYAPADATLHTPDPMLAEGAPCSVPNWRPYPSQLFADGARIEAAFRKYFHRSVDGWRANYKYQAALKKAEKAGDPAPDPPSYDAENDEEGNDTYELVVCHGNVIRYFMCRALQLPPTGWLRLATYNCGLSHFQIRPSGSVSMLGQNYPTPPPHHTHVAAYHPLPAAVRCHLATA
jgi:serine/threonine-protein phosphatase PGAM5